jgi:hypothetical protein
MPFLYVGPKEEVILDTTTEQVCLPDFLFFTYLLISLACPLPAYLPIRGEHRESYSAKAPSL